MLNLLRVWPWRVTRVPSWHAYCIKNFIRTIFFEQEKIDYMHDKNKSENY